MDYQAAYELEKIRNQKIMEKYNTVSRENKALKEKIQAIKEFVKNYEG